MAAIALLLSVPVEAGASGLTRAPAYEARVSTLPPAVRELMTGSSWHPGCPVGLNDLRLIRLTYWGFDRQAHPGKLVVHRRWADKIARVFGKIYDARFPIRRMRLVDRYGADDMRSMRADNTSAFNCRYRDGECCTWSQHAYGRAIDINPVENPWRRPHRIEPAAGRAFVDRRDVRPGMFVRPGPVVAALDELGWEWGGDWRHAFDDHHLAWSRPLP